MNKLARALASDKRILILQWLKDPRRHFPPQVDGDLVRTAFVVSGSPRS